MSFILDTGALLAIERYDHFTTALVSAEYEANRIPLSHGGVVGQVWRGGGARQARLAKLLATLEIAPLDEALGRRAGALCARARTSNVLDAAVVLLAADGDFILTSDPAALEPLAFAAGLQVEIVAV